MKKWTEYKSHDREVYFERGNIYDNTIYTFDIETTSVVLYENKIYNQDFYDTLSEKEKKNSKVYGFMYVWQFSINDVVYYGRTWEEFKQFLKKVFYDTKIISYIYVHNLSMEMQFLRSLLNITKVFARQKYKPIYFECKNLVFRCSYYLTQAKLEKLPDLYDLPVKKLVGDLDYTKIRHHNTALTKKEFEYCENDCLILYELIKKFKAEYKKIKSIPITKTGILRRKTQNEMSKSKSFKLKMYDIATNDVDLFNAETLAFSGGYTHANFYHANEVKKNIQPYDICSSYPYIMCCEKVFPQEAFREFKHTTLDTLSDKFIYLINIRISNLKSKKQNTILSISKCQNVSRNHALDNGRFLFCESLEAWVTNFDFEMLKNFYDFDYELIKIYGSPAGYLPKDFIKFILEIYEKKTKLKNVVGSELEYSRAKSDFNSLYGMCVTNTIRDEIEYNNDEWIEKVLTKDEKISKLDKENKKLFLNFSYGVFITSKARYNLLTLVNNFDEYNTYSDTDSLKLLEDFPKKYIYRYNQKVIQTIIKAKKHLSLSGFSQKDIKGNNHTLGIIEKEKEKYKKFKVLGSKKYCYEDEKEQLHITVAGVPKQGANALKSIDDFSEDFIFHSKDTGKLQLFYNEEKDIVLTVTDYLGNTEDIMFSYGIGFVPCSYKLKQSSQYIPFEDFNINRSLI